MPPPRRRPVPTPPAGGRPKVAGLHRRTSGEQTTRPAAPAEPTEAAPPAEAVTPEVVEPKPTPESTVPESTAAPEVTSDQAAVPGRVEAEAADQAADQPEAAGQPEPGDSPASAWSDPLPELDTESTPDPAKRRPITWHLPAALVAVAVLLAALGTFFLVKSRAVDYDAALVDTGTTSEVNGQVREAVERAFSYNFADVAATERAAAELLTGRALCQYNAVFGPVKEVAPQQKLVVTVRVVSSAVSSLRDGHATVLVFADQVTTRTTDNQSGGGTAMLRVGAVADGGRWKIDNMEMFGATAEQNRQLEGC
ncbi:Mce-associated membrane protein [Lentzea fradiae]|uniref:Mce-associated membrane protein n=1 Tax=Lentzea fradiae TaxID=200378 RepID=A0A1G7MUP7_9PSEU|nr:hypothetical protein [Lentzea fradiae]SDF65545.1 Mce-associated membrane protein [Lentzea fradiae]